MKQKFTLLALLFMFSIFAFGQSKFKNHENRFKTKVERNVKASNHYNQKYINEKIYKKQQQELQRTALKSAQENKHRLDSMVDMSWDSFSSQWVSDFKEELIYNSKGDIVEHFYYEMNEISGQWVISWKTVYAYDDDGNVMTETDYVWDDTEDRWAISWKTEFTYDSNKNVLTESSSEWNQFTSQLVEVSRIEYTHDEFGLTELIDYEYDGESESLVPYLKQVILYDTSGVLTTYQNYLWDAGPSQWFVAWKVELTYDSNHNLSEYVNFFWDEDSGDWLDYSKSAFTYDENGNIKIAAEYDKDMITSQFVMTWKGEYEYDGNGNPTMESYYDYDEESSEFIIYSKYEYTYDLSFGLNDLVMPSVFWFTPDFSDKIMNKPIGYISYYWDTELEEWVGNRKSSYYYSEDISTRVNELGNGISKLFPNPVSDQLTFSIAGKAGKAVFVLYDLHGRKILTREVHNNDNVDLKSINSGMYFYNLFVDGNRQTGKLIKE